MYVCMYGVWLIVGTKPSHAQKSAATNPPCYGQKILLSPFDKKIVTNSFPMLLELILFESKLLDLELILTSSEAKPRLIFE